MSPLRGAIAAAGIALTAGAAVIAPLWTYALSLALFGLPHVVTELRYVDERFARRSGARLVTLLVAGLLAIAALRAAGVAGFGTAPTRAAIELLAGGVLIAMLLPRLRARGTGFAALGGSILALSILAAALAPLDALVVFALLHNLTPVGFLAERLRGAPRRRALWLAAVVFGAVPLLILTGAGTALMATIGIEPSSTGPRGVGPLETHLGVFVPATWRPSEFGLDLFRAAAFLQCMHYAAVLHLLPRLGGASETDGSWLRWPARPTFAITVMATGALMFGGFAFAFGDARLSYGVFAAVHAWVEIPVLLLACAVPAVRDAPGVA